MIRNKTNNPDEYDTADDFDENENNSGENNNISTHLKQT